MRDESCLFCRIATDDLPSRTVLSTDSAQAFLDVNPLAPGHTLVIPTDHYERLQDFPPDAFGAFWTTVHSLIPAIESAVDADATTVGINNGEASGQEVPHAHVHIVPRFHGDGGSPIHAVGGAPPLLADDDLDAIAEAIEGTLE